MPKVTAKYPKLGAPSSASGAHPRSAEYGRARKKQFLISMNTSKSMISLAVGAAMTLLTSCRPGDTSEQSSSDSHDSVLQSSIAVAARHDNPRPLASTNGGRSPRLVTKETVVGQIAAETRLSSFSTSRGLDDSRVAYLVSPTGTHVAYQLFQDGSWRTFVNGSGGAAFDTVRYPDFFAQKDAVCYEASDGMTNLYVVQALPGQTLQAAGVYPIYPQSARPKVSPDGRRIARIVKGNGKFHVVVDEARGKDFDEILTLLFSPDSAHFMYSAKVGSKWRMVVDGTEGMEYESIGGLPTFSPDGQRHCYGAKRNGKWCAVVDNREGKLYDSTGGQVFSPDGRRLAYRAKEKNQWRVVVDSIEGDLFDDGCVPRFSPDSKRLAYTARRGDKWLVMADDKQLGGEYDKVDFLSFSPDGVHVAFLARTADKSAVLVDGAEDPRYPGLPLWSTNGAHFACLKHRDGLARIVIDGKEGAGYAWVDKPVFSPDGTRIAYAARRGGKWIAVVDGNESAEYDEIANTSPGGHLRLVTTGPVAGGTSSTGPGVFDSLAKPNMYWSSDGRRVAYRARRGNDWVLVIDGLESKPYEGFLHESYPAFTGPDSLRVLALRTTRRPGDRPDGFFSFGTGFYLYDQEFLLVELSVQEH